MAEQDAVKERPLARNLRLAKAVSALMFFFTIGLPLLALAAVGRRQPSQRAQKWLSMPASLAVKFVARCLGLKKPEEMITDGK